MMNISNVEKDEVIRQELIKIQKGDGQYNPKTGVYKYGDNIYDLTKTNGEGGLGYPPIQGKIIKYERQSSAKEIKNKDMLEFKSKSEHNITGRGKVFCVVSQSDDSVVGETVIIDDKKYQVTGQEVMGKIEKGRDTGLLVKEISEQDEPKTLSISVKLTLKQIQELEKVRAIIEDAPQNKLEDIAKLILPKNKDMRTAKKFMEYKYENFKPTAGYLLDREEYADYKVANSAKKIKTENLFENLEYAKFKIQEVFSNKYFEGELDCYWLGEVLSISDAFIDLENIQYALENNIYEPVLFKYLSKPRNFNLEDYCLGKVGRKSKKKEELKKCKENVNYAWEQLQEAIAQEHLEEIKTNKTDIFKERNIYNNLEDKE